MQSKPLLVVSRSLPNQVEASIELITDQYRRASGPWILGFSGGKDSSALLRLTYSALVRARKHATPVTIVYCDTGVDIPVIADLVRCTLRRVSREAKEEGLPLRVRVARPRVEDSFFVKVIGRGSTTNKQV